MSKNTIKRSQLSGLRMGDGEGKPCKVILDGQVMNYVGIGWVDEGVASAKDKKEYPTVVD